MSNWRVLLGGALVLGFGCRKPNPEWQGPASDTNGFVTSGGTASGGTMSGGTMADGTAGGASSAASADSTGAAMCSVDGDCAEPTPLCLDGVCVAPGEGTPCNSNSGCPDVAPFCNPDGACQDGSEGDPCASNGPADCSDVAPFCAVDDQCHDGSPGDPCGDPDQCMSGTCTNDACE